jgi:hypothetical protein
MKPENKNSVIKKDSKKIPLREKDAGKSVRPVKKNLKVDTDFHHVHPFKEH